MELELTVDDMSKITLFHKLINMLFGTLKQFVTRFNFREMSFCSCLRLVQGLFCRYIRMSTEPCNIVPFMKLILTKPCQ